MEVGSRGERNKVRWGREEGRLGGKGYGGKRGKGGPEKKEEQSKVDATQSLGLPEAAL